MELKGHGILVHCNGRSDRVTGGPLYGSRNAAVTRVESRILTKQVTLGLLGGMEWQICQVGLLARKACDLNLRVHSNETNWISNKDRISASTDPLY